MKTSSYLILLCASFLMNNATFSQVINDACFTRKVPLSVYSYRRMMRDHYNFTIMGSQTPVSGFKIETNKPTITLKGNISSPKNNRDLLVNFELTGGVQNHLMQILSGDEVNGYFKGSIGFNKMITSGNNAKYIMPDEFLKRMTRAKVCQYREEIARQIDTMLVLEALESFIKPYTTPTLSDIAASVATRARMDEFTFEHYRRPFDDSVSPDYYKKLILEVIKNYGADIAETDEDKRFRGFINSLSDNKSPHAKVAKLVGDYNRLAKFNQTGDINTDCSTLMRLKHIRISGQVSVFHGSTYLSLAQMQL